MATDEERQAYRAASAKLDAAKRRLRGFGQTIERMGQLFAQAEHLHIESAAEGRSFASSADARLPRVLQDQWPSIPQLTTAIDALANTSREAEAAWGALGNDTSDLTAPTRSVN